MLKLSHVHAGVTTSAGYLTCMHIVAMKQRKLLFPPVVVLNKHLTVRDQTMNTVRACDHTDGLITGSLCQGHLAHLWRPSPERESGNICFGFHPRHSWQ